MEEGLYQKRIEFKRKEVKGRLEDILENRIEPSESARIASIFVDAAVDYAESQISSLEKKYAYLDKKIEYYMKLAEEMRTKTFIDRLGELLTLKDVDDLGKEKGIEVLKYLKHQLMEKDGEKASEELLLFLKNIKKSCFSVYSFNTHLEGVKKASESYYCYEDELVKNLFKLYLTNSILNVGYFVLHIERLAEESKKTQSMIGDPNFTVARELPKLLLKDVELKIIDFYLGTVAELREKYQPVDNDCFCAEVARQIPKLLLEGADFKAVESYVSYVKGLDTLHKQHGREVAKQLSEMFLNGTSKGLMDLYVKTVKDISVKSDTVATAAAGGIPELFEELNFDQLENWIEFGIKILENEEPKESCHSISEGYFGLSRFSNEQKNARELLKKGYNVVYLAKELSIAFKDKKKE